MGRSLAGTICAAPLRPCVHGSLDITAWRMRSELNDLRADDCEVGWVQVSEYSAICPHSAAERMPRVITFCCTPTTGRRNSRQPSRIIVGKVVTDGRDGEQQHRCGFAGTEIMALMPQALETRPRGAATPSGPRSSAFRRPENRETGYNGETGGTALRCSRRIRSWAGRPGPAPSAGGARRPSRYLSPMKPREWSAAGGGGRLAHAE
jgi:hypothetical protein